MFLFDAYDDLLKIVREDVLKHLANAETDESRVLSNVCARPKVSDLENAKRELADAESQLEELRVKLSKLYEEHFAKVISLDVFKASAAKLEDERVKVQANADALAKAIAESERQTTDVSSWLTAIREYLSFENPTHEALAALVEKIEVGENMGTWKQRVQSVRICYRFVGAVV